MEEEAHRQAHEPLLPRASSLHSASSHSRFGPCLASDCEHLGMTGRVSSEGERESESERRRAGGRAGVRTSREGQSARRSLACPLKSLALPLVLACARLENELAERGDTSCSPSALKRFRLLASSGRRGAVEPRAALAAQLAASRLAAWLCFCASPSCSTSGREREVQREARERSRRGPGALKSTKSPTSFCKLSRSLSLARSAPTSARTVEKGGGRPASLVARPRRPHPSPAATQTRVDPPLCITGQPSQDVARARTLSCTS